MAGPALEGRSWQGFGAAIKGRHSFGSLFFPLATSPASFSALLQSSFSEELGLEVYVTFSHLSTLYPGFFRSDGVTSATVGWKLGKQEGRG